jgi:hypothetical protein
MSQTLLSLAGFQVILIGRFWVIAEVKGRLRRFEPRCSHRLALDDARRYRHAHAGGYDLYLRKETLYPLLVCLSLFASFT